MAGMRLFKEVFGEVVRERRLDLNLTLRQASERAFVSYSFWSEVERGVKECGSIFMNSIAVGLGVGLDELIIETGYRLSEDLDIKIPDTPEALFVRDAGWAAQYADLK
jgi:transcriptional regulator with XRE-family HTH domain